jgi:hypothetical protein
MALETLDRATTTLGRVGGFWRALETFGQGRRPLDTFRQVSRPMDRAGTTEDRFGDLWIGSGQC